jgi:hypothetical protein
MRTLWNDDRRDEILRRVESVEPAATPRWGRMNAAQMLAHLHESLRMATGDLAVKPKRMPLRYFPLKQLIVYVLPFPKRAPTAPELIVSEPPSAAITKLELHRLLHLFAERRTSEAWPEHPVFGVLGRKGWGVLVYRHMDHHLRQFGA